MEKFTKDIDDLQYLTRQKVKLTDYLKKNYKENIHYIIKTDTCKNKINNDGTKKHGGQNKIIYMLTEEAFELMKNSYNLRNRYIVNINDNVKQINIGMCIENQTIGFIENSYINILNIKRQYFIDNYRVDLYFIDHKLVIECDENNHIDRDSIKEKIRQEYIVSLGNNIIRYNPNDKLFDISNVLNKINKILFEGSRYSIN